MNFITSAIGVIYYGRFRFNLIQLNRPQSVNRPFYIGWLGYCHWIVQMLLKCSLWWLVFLKMFALLHQDVVDSFNITESIIPTRAASKQPSTANTTPEINGGASTSERARASSAGRTTPKSPRSAHAGPSGASTSSKSSVSRSASATSLSTTRRASRRHWAIEDSDDDDACKTF